MKDCPTQRKIYSDAIFLNGISTRQKRTTFKGKSTYQGMVFIEIVRYIANERVVFWVFYIPVFFGLKNQGFY